MHLPERFWYASFEKIADVEEDGIRQKHVLGAYLRRIDEMMARGLGLMLWGDNSNGKTSAAAIIAKHARRHGYTVLFTTAAELLDRMKAKAFFDATRTTTFYDRAMAVDLLVVDDFGKERHAPSGYEEGLAADLFENLTRTRLHRLRSMVLTTNMNPKRIAPLDSDTSEQAFYKRSMGEVMTGSILPVRMRGPNHREAEQAVIERVLVGPPANDRPAPERRSRRDERRTGERG